MNQNPGLNILELGKTHLYINSQYSFYYDNLTSVTNEYYKLINNKNEIFNHIDKNLTIELKTYINILKFNCERIGDDCKNFNRKLRR